jgi:hypothetical protein
MQKIFADCLAKGVTMQRLQLSVNRAANGKNPQSAWTSRRRFAATGKKPPKGGTFGLGLIFSILEAMSDLTGDKYELKILRNGQDII